MRSILFALGVSCLILGVQSLVVDHVVLKQQRPLAGLQNSFRQQVQVRQPPQAQLDPNYYNGPFSNNGALGYGGNSNPVNQPYQFAGYQQPAGNPLSANNPLAGTVSNVGARRIFKPAEWMPWGFFVAGFVLVLFSKRSHGE